MFTRRTAYDRIFADPPVDMYSPHTPSCRFYRSTYPPVDLYSLHTLPADLQNFQNFQKVKKVKMGAVGVPVRHRGALVEIGMANLAILGQLGPALETPFLGAKVLKNT